MSEPSWTDIASFAILALAAIVAAWQVWEARRLREDQTRPFVVVDFEIENTVFFLVVSYIGKTLARDLRIRIEPTLASSIDSTNERLAQLKMLVSIP